MAYVLLKHRVEFFSNKGSGWIIDKIEDIWINVINYNALAGSSYIPLHSKLNNSMKGLINIQNTKDNEYFKWYHIRLLNPQDKEPSRINKSDREIA